MADRAFPTFGVVLATHHIHAVSQGEVLGESAEEREAHPHRQEDVDHVFVEEDIADVRDEAHERFDHGMHHDRNQGDSATPEDIRLLYTEFVLPFRLRSDLTRHRLADVELAFGLECHPGSESLGLRAGWSREQVSTLDSEFGMEPRDSWHIMVDRHVLPKLLHRLWPLLGRSSTPVFPVIELGSRDAFRAVDTFVGADPLPLAEFLSTVRNLETLLLEDAHLAFGAYSDEEIPSEVFVDHWKGIALTVRSSDRERVEAILEAFHLTQVEETWSKLDDRQAEQVLSIRNIFEPIPSGIPDPALLQPDVDHFLLYLRRCWSLVPNLEDWESNLDEAGRSLGRCLWMVQGVVRNPQSNLRARLVVWAQAAHPRALSKTLLAWAKDQPQWVWEDELGTDRLSWEDAPPEVDVAREGVKGDAVLHSLLEELDPLTADLVQLLAEEFPPDDTQGERFDAID